MVGTSSMITLRARAASDLTASTRLAMRVPAAAAATVTRGTSKGRGHWCNRHRHFRGGSGTRCRSLIHRAAIMPQAPATIETAPCHHLRQSQRGPLRMQLREGTNKLSAQKGTMPLPDIQSKVAPTWIRPAGDSRACCGDPADQVNEASRILRSRSLLIVVEVDKDVPSLPTPSGDLVGPVPQGSRWITPFVSPTRAMAAHVNVARCDDPG